MARRRASLQLGGRFGHMLYTHTHGIPCLLFPKRLIERTLTDCVLAVLTLSAVACASEIQRTRYRKEIRAQNRRVVVESLPRNGRRACDAQPQAQESERLQILHVRAPTLVEHTNKSRHRIAYGGGGHGRSAQEISSKSLNYCRHGDGRTTDLFLSRRGIDSCNLQPPLSWFNCALFLCVCI